MSNPRAPDDLQHTPERSNQQRRGLLSNTLVYGSASAVSTAIPVLLAPILTFYLEPQDYGILMVFDIIMKLLSPLVGLGTQGAIRRRYFDTDSIELSTYVTSALGLVLISFSFWSFVLVVVCLIGSDWLPGHSVWLLIIIPWIGAHYLLSVGLSFLQLEGAALHYGLIQGGLVLLNLVLSLVLVIGIEMAWEGRMLGQVAAYVIFAVVGVMIIRRRITITRFDRDMATDALSYGAPMIPYAVLDRVTALADRALVIVFVGLGAGGLYSLASQVAGLLLLAATSFSLAWHPWLFARLRDNSRASRRAIIVSITWAGAACLLCGIALNAVSPMLLPIIIDERFLGLLEFIPWLCAAFVARGWVSIAAGILLFEGQTGVMAKVTLVAACANIVGNLLLIPRFGAIGAAQATCIAFALAAVLMVWSARQSWIRLAPEATA